MLPLLIFSVAVTIGSTQEAKNGRIRFPANINKQVGPEQFVSESQAQPIIITAGNGIPHYVIPKAPSDTSPFGQVSDKGYAEGIIIPYQHTKNQQEFHQTVPPPLFYGPLQRYFSQTQQQPAYQQNNPHPQEGHRFGPQRLTYNELKSLHPTKHAKQQIHASGLHFTKDKEENPDVTIYRYSIVTNHGPPRPSNPNEFEMEIIRGVPDFPTPQPSSSSYSRPTTNPTKGSHQSSFYSTKGQTSQEPTATKDPELESFPEDIFDFTEEMTDSQFNENFSDASKESDLFFDKNKNGNNYQTSGFPTPGSSKQPTVFFDKKKNEKISPVSSYPTPTQPNLKPTGSRPTQGSYQRPSTTSDYKTKRPNLSSYTNFGGNHHDIESFERFPGFPSPIKEKPSGTRPTSSSYLGHSIDSTGDKKTKRPYLSTFSNSKSNDNNFERLEHFQRFPSQLKGKPNGSRPTQSSYSFDSSEDFKTKRPHSNSHSNSEDNNDQSDFTSYEHYPPSAPPTIKKTNGIRSTQRPGHPSDSPNNHKTKRPFFERFPNFNGGNKGISSFENNPGHSPQQHKKSGSRPQPGSSINAEKYYKTKIPSSSAISNQETNYDSFEDFPDYSSIVSKKPGQNKPTLSSYSGHSGDFSKDQKIKRPNLSSYSNVKTKQESFDTFPTFPKQQTNPNTNYFPTLESLGYKKGKVESVYPPMRKTSNKENKQSKNPIKFPANFDNIKSIETSSDFSGENFSPVFDFPESTFKIPENPNLNIKDNGGLAQKIFKKLQKQQDNEDYDFDFPIPFKNKNQQSNDNHDFNFSPNPLSKQQNNKSASKFNFDFFDPTTQKATKQTGSSSFGSEWIPINAPEGAVPAKSYDIPPPDLSKGAFQDEAWNQENPREEYDGGLIYGVQKKGNSEGVVSAVFRVKQ